MNTFSIITVVYNDVARITSTMKSVINQSFKNIEYILIDGKSNDGTDEEILKNLLSCATITQQIREKERFYLEATHNIYPALTFKFLSEKDCGIYDAMNKGVSLASKKWINFMNCGDSFYNCNVLQNIIKYDIEHYDVVYGNTLFVYPQGYCQIFPSKVVSFKNPMSFCHQSSFIKTKTIKNFYFDTYFKICSDFHLFSRLVQEDFRFKKIDLPIAQYDYNGISSKPSLAFFRERSQITKRKKNFLPIFCILNYLYGSIIFYFKVNLPKNILSWIYGVKFRK